MGQAGAEVVAFMGDEDLGLLLQPAESRGVDDAVAVARKGRAGATGPLRVLAAPRPGRIRGIGSAGDGGVEHLSQAAGLFRWSGADRI